jgi:hypothetical protein
MLLADEGADMLMNRFGIGESQKRKERCNASNVNVYFT